MTCNRFHITYINTFISEVLQNVLTEAVIPDAANQTNVCTKPCCGYRLIGSFSAGIHLKLLTKERLADLRYLSRYRD
ncbi:hypothetical protein D3C77_634320 [compost metagenome]